MYEACLFDYGNTLVEFDRPQMQRVVKQLRDELCRRFGPIEAEAVAQAMDRLYELPRRGETPTYQELPPADQMAILLDDLYGPDSRPRAAVVEADAALQAIFIESVEISPEYRETLAALSKKMPIGLVSNYPCAKAIRATLERIEIADLFKVVIVSGEVGFVKPHRRMFEEAVSRMGVAADRTLFVGDRWDADICGARDYGLPSCHMVGFTSETGWEERYRVHRPDHVVKSLSEVVAILEGR